VAIKVRKTEHAGPKNGGGAFRGARVDAKDGSKKVRRADDRRAVAEAGRDIEAR
jgi:hypothetical protein